MICFAPASALFHIYLKRVYVNVYILFFKISVWIYICGPHDIWIELWVPHSCLFPTTTFLGHASFNAPKVSSCLCRDVPNTKDHLDSNIHEQWVRRPQYNGVWTLAFQDTKLHCWSTKLLRCDSRSRTLRGVRLFFFLQQKSTTFFLGGKLENHWSLLDLFPFFPVETRFIRMLRLTRLVRLVRTLRFEVFYELKMMVFGALASVV